jgi:hypothetical protein
MAIAGSLIAQFGLYFIEGRGQLVVNVMDLLKLL